MAASGDPSVSLQILDHVAGHRAVPNTITDYLLSFLAFPSHPTPRLLRRLTTSLSTQTLDVIEQLHSQNPSPLADSAHLAVAARLAATSTPDSSASLRNRVRRVIRHPDAAGRMAAAADGGEEAALEKVRALVESEWAALPPSILDNKADKLASEGTGEKWRVADEVTREVYGLLVGERPKRGMLHKLGQSTSGFNPVANPVATPEVDKVANALKSGHAELCKAALDPPTNTVQAAEKVFNRRVGKRVAQNVEELMDQPGFSHTKDQHALDNKGMDQMRRLKRNIMDWSPTTRTFEWEDSDRSQAPSNNPCSCSPN